MLERLANIEKKINIEGIMDDNITKKEKVKIKT